MSTTPDLAVLQTIRLKGRVNLADLTDRRETVDAMVDAGLLVAAPMVRLTDEGRTRLAELLAVERETIDRGAAAEVYERFLVINAGLKPLISQWQLTRDSASQDDVAAVLAGVDGLHRQVLPVIAAASELVPRLGDYAERLDAALRRAREGDMSWLTRPMVDSYHTVWFELHEELIGMAGRTRADEAD